jgi:hypothetical protein
MLSTTKETENYQAENWVEEKLIASKTHIIQSYFMFALEEAHQGENPNKQTANTPTDRSYFSRFPPLLLLFLLFCD